MSLGERFLRARDCAQFQPNRQATQGTAFQVNSNLEKLRGTVY